MSDNSKNRTEGFDPMQYARKIKDGNGDEVLYLDVQYRKRWFREENPNGKIEKKIVSFDGGLAVVEARIYLDRNDQQENFISNAFAQRFADPNNLEYGNRYLESAETAAVGRALADAGYGLQFAVEPDQTPVDMGQSIVFARPQQNEHRSAQGQIPVQQRQPVQAIPSQPQPNIPPQSIPAQRQTTAQQRQVQPNTPPQRQAEQAITSQPQQRQVQQRQVQQRQPQPETPPQSVPPQPQQTQQQVPTFTHQTPVAEIVRLMPYEEAVKVVYRCNGSLDGKTMGQIAAENFGYLQWLAEKCNTPKNLFKGAAQIIVREHLTRNKN